MRQQRSFRRAVFCAVIALLSALSYAAAVTPDCSETQCHFLAWCDFNSANQPVCNCQPGTIDKSGGSGLNCDTDGYSIRYVVQTNPLPTENPTADVSREDAMAMCVSAEGYWLRRIVGNMLEVNCIYSTRPDNTSAYGDTQSPGGITYDVKPAIYTWRTPTTSQPLAIPPTDLEVSSVHFKSDCAETGCWVIKGTLTTGEAFNGNGALNTFFLPQANISGVHPQGDISYDYDYGAVEWTFSTANNPCSFRGLDWDERMSTCCISNPTQGSTGGFVANYRPTEAFVEWSGKLGCDVLFDRAREKKCWKLFKELNTWEGANDRCASAGGHLAMIVDDDEKARIHSYLNLATQPETDNWVGDPALYTAAFVWIGLKRITSGSGNFTWIDETSYDGNLNLNYPTENNNDCVHKMGKGAYSTTYCHRENAFMCEFDPPTFDETCIKHVIQRPMSSSPKLNRPCWDMQTWEDSAGWLNAKAHCEAQGGFLPVIDNAEENWFFHRLLDWKGHWYAWVGVTRTNATLDDWSYPDGVARSSFYKKPSDKNSKPWRIGTYPNDLPWCVLVGPGGLWSNADCERVSSVVCEFDRDAHPDKVCTSDELEDLGLNWDLGFPQNAMAFIDVGKFKGMNASPGIVSLTNVDPFFGQYSFEIELDEVELRSEAGKLRGTVGVEHTVDTYLGLVNFRTTGLEVLDTFATQVNIHLEKTSFFSVSTHGVNEYTFLEYVNMRLVQILDEDSDFSGQTDSSGNGDDESAARTVRTNTTGNAAYVQVTFTMGPQYQPNLPVGLIQLDSVRAGMGIFFDTVNAAGKLEHLCSEYDDADDDENIGLTYDGGSGNSRGLKGTYNTLVGQDCGPQASMCTSPEEVPDQFVSFNIPLGFEVFDNQASNDLINNIFVDFVVNAVDTKAKELDSSPNAGQSPWQMKTTLTASIPIVAGGLNIFCDGFTAKTDLKDVANVDIVVGSANNANELTRLRILQDIASSDLDVVPSSRIDTASIESGLMTLVIKGNASYFSPGSSRNTIDYTMELDDVITLHLMEDGQATDAEEDDGSKEGEVIRLLSIPGDDNTNANGLDTNGYALNGAFYFTIDRDNNVAHLEPSDALLAVCPFNPPRPAPNSVPLESCILRRDVRNRDYPSRLGAEDTAMEILAAYRIDADDVQADLQPLLPKDCTEADIDDAALDLGVDSEESDFLARILGDSDYTRQLAPNFARAIHERYQLNGRFRRAYWINPGYEWTPTQTAGRSLFSISQKIYLFALISLDENWSRRRMLLQTTSDPLADRDAGMNQAKMEFEVTPMSMMASAFDVPVDRVALFDVELQLTAAEACMAPAELQNALRYTLEDYLEESASTFWTAQVTSLQVDMGDEKCSGNGRRNIRKLLASYSSATATIKMLIVFKEDTESRFNQDKFASMPGVNSVAADARNSPKIAASPGTTAAANSGGSATTAGSGGGSEATTAVSGGGGAPDTTAASGGNAGATTAASGGGTGTTTASGGGSGATTASGGGGSGATTAGHAPASTTPVPAAQTFALKVTTVLTGVTAAQLKANLGGFRSAVAKLHAGKTAADVVVDEASIQDVTAAHRRLLADGVSVSYEVKGFETAAAADAAKVVQEAGSTALVTILKAEGDEFQGLTEVTSTAALLNASRGARAWASWTCTAAAALVALAVPRC